MYNLVDYYQHVRNLLPQFLGNLMMSAKLYTKCELPVYMVSHPTSSEVICLVLDINRGETENESLWGKETEYFSSTKPYRMEMMLEGAK
jgi:hypothetical protein